jgi:hypothetical protein
MKWRFLANADLNKAWPWRRFGKQPYILQISLSLAAQTHTLSDKFLISF